MTWGPATREGLTATDGGVTAAEGFRAAGVAAGLKRSGGLDLALVVSDGPAAAAATTTTNRLKAAPCVVTERHVADGRARAVVLNSGCANACTGADGVEDAEATAAVVARALGLEPTDVLVCSTGVIGERLPVDLLLDGVRPLVDALDRNGATAAAEAIMTTDTAPKQAAYVAEDAAGVCLVGGMAKGAAGQALQNANLMLGLDEHLGLTAAGVYP